MEGLDRLTRKGCASNAQVMFLAINTAGVTLVPTKVIALRASLGAADPAAVMAPTLIASLVAAVVAVASAARLLQRPDGSETAPAAALASGWRGLAALVLTLVPAMPLLGRAVGPWLVPTMVAAPAGLGSGQAGSGLRGLRRGRPRRLLRWRRGDHRT